MADRQEPTISSIRPEQDEIIRHRKNQSGGGPRRPSTPNNVVVQKSVLAPFAFFVALIAVGFSGFVYWQLGEAKKARLAAEDRILALEKQLEMSDDESSASLVAVQAKLKWADSEIRKLWGVSHDTNRKAIAKNRETLDAVEASSKKLSRKVESTLKSVQGDVKLLNDIIEAQQSSLSNIEQQSARDTLLVQEAMDQLDRAESELKGRIKTNEAAIEAIDEFRRQVNQELLNLKR